MALRERSQCIKWSRSSGGTVG